MLVLAFMFLCLSAALIYTARPADKHVLTIGAARVTYSDQELRSSAGADRILRRIRAAAGDQCGIAPVPRRRSRIQLNDCLRASIGEAVDDAGGLVASRYQSSG